MKIWDLKKVMIKVKYPFLFISLVLLLTSCGNSRVEKKETKVSTDSLISKDLEITAEESETPPPLIIEDTSVSVVMVGDMLLHDPLLEGAETGEGTYNFDHFFLHTKELLQESDFAIANMEVILGGTELGISGYPSFNGPYEMGDALVAAGFDVILQGTNHALDRGKQGILNCLNFWRTSYPEISVLGIYDTQEASDQLYVFEKNNIKIAILNYTYGTNGIKIPEEMPYCVNMLDQEQMREDILRAEELADVTIVCPHWGTEYQLTESEYQREFCEFMAELGVDLVIGTHPHVIQPVEWYETEAGQKMLVYYSLGNYVNATSGTGIGTANRMLGAMATIEFEKQESGQVEIVSYDALPLVTHLVEHGKAETYFLNDYSETLANQNIIRNQDETFTYEYIKDVWNQVLGSLHPVK